MSIPTGLTTITVNIDFTGAGGAADSGTISFAPPVDVLFPGTAVLSRTPQVVTLVNGIGSIVLVTTDNATLNPNSWGYTVTVALAGLNFAYQYTGVGIPSTYGASVNLATVLPPQVPTPITPNTYGALAQPNTWMQLQTFSGGVNFPTANNGITSWFNVKSPAYGATGNGTTDDTAAIQAAINAAAAAGGGSVVYFPEGTYKVTPSGTPAIALNMSGMQGVRLVGDSAYTSVLVKNGNGTILNMSGPSTDTTGNTHCKYCSLENLGFNGNTTTGSLLLTYYADNLYFRDCRFTNNYGVVQDTAEFWDSRYYNCVWEDCGSTTFGTAAPNVLLRNSAAATGFGFSTDNVDQIHFVGCRWEDFRTGAVTINQGLSNTNNENGIFFLDCKMESSFLNGGVHLSIDTAARAVFVTNLYCFSGGFESGNTTAQDVITWGPEASAMVNVWISDRSGTATVANGVTVNSAVATEASSLINVIGIYPQAPTGAHINFNTLTGAVMVLNCNSNNGTQWAGTPTMYAPGVPLTQASGAVADTSFASTPLDGTLGLDILNHRLYLRENNGIWNFVPIKTVSSAVTTSTTIANTAALSTLQSATVPAGDPQTASVYEVCGHGIFSTTGTPTMTFALYWGGTSGTLLASIPAITAPSGAANLLFSYEAKVTFRSSTSCVAVLKLYFDTASGTEVATVYLGGLGTTATVTSATAQSLAVGFTWGAASASNTISCQGGYIEKIR